MIDHEQIQSMREVLRRHGLEDEFDALVTELDEARKAIGGILAWARGDKNTDYAEAEKRAEAAL